MNNTNETIEKLIERTVQLLDEGKSVSDILNLFPENQKEIKEIIQIINDLSAERKKVVPLREPLSRILAQIPSVTKDEMSRYLFERGEKLEGRSSLITIIKPKIHDFMTINWKVWAPLGIIAVVAFVVVSSYQFGAKAPEALVAEETPQAPIAVSQELPIVVVKPPTGNTDDAVNAILASVSDDLAIFTDAEKDAELLAVDSQVISGFGQSYNENEF